MPASDAAVTMTNPEPSDGSLLGLKFVIAAMNIGRRVFSRMCHGCFFPASPVHSYQPSAGTMARPDFHMCRKYRPDAAFSIRALIAIGMPFSAAHLGRYPQCTRSILGWPS